MTFKIGGIQQVGIGVSNAETAFDYYKENYGFNVKIFDDAATATLMKQYTGNEAQTRRAILSLNENGGGGFEIWQFTSRIPKAAKEFGPGDLGIVALGVHCPKSDKAHWQRDGFGNLFRHIPSAKSSGVREVFIGVSSLDKSVPFYKDLLHNSEVSHGELEFEGETFKTVSLFISEPGKTAFSKILGPFTITLMESPNGVHYYENRYWGDKGYIHMCLDIENMDGLKAHCKANGVSFSVDSESNFDMGDTGGRFAYVEDPDGTLIELVEVLKFPISKKPRIQIPLHWKILKPLPMALLKVLK
tara:strand:- start:34991 stop:35896 length:906 start_codon:yes stop_codon:yes gene_type:complete